MSAFGPESGDLLVLTHREGAVAKAGHDLTLRAASWEATLADGRLELTAWPESLEVIDGSGGAKPLSDRDRREIQGTIVTKVLGREPVRFSGPVPAGGGTVSGELTVGGRTAPCEVRLEVDGERVTGVAVVTQSRFGIKPYSAFLGALRVSDDVEVRFSGSATA